jgi:vancomycin resistance protein YoaR
MNKTIKAILIGLGLGVLAAVLLVSLKIKNEGTYYPNTFIEDVDISYLSQQQALNKIKPLIEKELSREVTIKLENNAVTANMLDLGLSVSAAEALQNAKRLEVSDFALSYLKSFIVGPADQKFTRKFDQSTLETFINNQLGFQKIEMLEPQFVINGKNIEISEGQTGKEIDFQKLEAEILSSQKEIEVPVILTEPTITPEELEVAKQDIAANLNKKITLIDPVYSDNWYLTYRDIQDWFVYKPEADNLTKIELRPEKLGEFLNEEVTQWLDKPVEHVEITLQNMNKSTEDAAQIQKENILFTGKGRDGMRIDRQKLKELIEDAFSSENSEIEIPVERIKPKIIIDEELQKLGITDRLAVGHTAYYGSPFNRIHNIKVGAERFNGLIIMPGEEFSFNTNLGAVDASTGYRQEKVIKPEGTIPEYGGGLCQVSTTMFRTVLDGGLEVTDRREHSYAVSYYSQIKGHGLDATIYLGGQDFKFRNDTENAILIQAFTDPDQELYVIFYGTPDGRSTSLEGPFIYGHRAPGATQYIKTNQLAPGEEKHVEKAHTGFSADWKYTITNKEGETEEKTIETTYKAIPAKVMVGEDEALESGEE